MKDDLIEEANTPHGYKLTWMIRVRCRLVENCEILSFKKIGTWWWVNLIWIQRYITYEFCEWVTMDIQITKNSKQIPAIAQLKLLAIVLCWNQCAEIISRMSQADIHPVHYCEQIGLLLNLGMAKEESYNYGINCYLSYPKFQLLNNYWTISTVFQLK